MLCTEALPHDLSDGHKCTLSRDLLKSYWCSKHTRGWVQECTARGQGLGLTVYKKQSYLKQQQRAWCCRKVEQSPTATCSESTERVTTHKTTRRSNPALATPLMGLRSHGGRLNIISHQASAEIQLICACLACFAGITASFMPELLHLAQQTHIQCVPSKHARHPQLWSTDSPADIASPTCRYSSGIKQIQCRPSTRHQVDTLHR